MEDRLSEENPHIENIKGPIRDSNQMPNTINQVKLPVFSVDIKFELMFINISF